MKIYIKISFYFALGCFVGIFLWLNDKSSTQVILVSQDTRLDAFVSPPIPQEKILLEGGVSYYSEAGCIGCREDQIMANGEVFDEDVFTLAVGIVDGKPSIPMNTEVIAKNLDNGKWAYAKVSDTGGFNVAKHNWRIADLSKGLAEFLEVKTDRSRVQILEKEQMSNE